MTDNSSPTTLLSTETLDNWLNALSSLTPANAANQLNQALKSLSHSAKLDHDLLALLTQLTPLAIHLSNSLLVGNHSDSSSSNHSKAIKVAKLSSQIFRHLSLLFYRLTETPSLSANASQQAIFHALQFGGYYLRNNALFYEPPSSTIWQNSAVLYKLAADRHWLQQPIVSKFHDFKALNTIEEVIKRNLLFSICAPTHYLAPEIHALFQLANQQHQQLEINWGPCRDFEFYWTLAEIPPVAIDQVHWTLPPQYLAIHSQSLAHRLQLGEIDCQLTPESRTRLVHQLTVFRPVFAATTIGPPLPACLLTGFKAVSNHLLEEDKLSKIMRLSNLPTSSKNSFRNMSLLPLEFEKNFENPNAPLNTGFQTPLVPARLLRNPSKQYLVAESHTNNLISGEMGLFFRQQNPTKLVIIRQQMVSEDVTLILMEAIEGSIDIYTIDNAAKESQQAIVVGANSASPEVFLPAGRYRSDSQISLQHGRSLYLEAYMEHSAVFSRFKIRFDS